jgi:uncharacterized ion transporter superfamily protein YfcC
MNETTEQANAPELPARSADAPPQQNSNAYDLAVTPGRRRIIAVTAGLGILVSVVASFTVSSPSLWGLLPIVLYAVLCLLGMDIVVATVVTLASGLILLHPAPAEIGTLLGKSLADQITVIGLVIVLGAGVGEILKVAGVADTIVRGVMRLVGEKSRTAVILGVMLACLILVASLGTLAGALAIAAPILLPIAARLGFTRAATASMMFVGGCAGLALAPFAGSNVAIMAAAKVDYLTYLAAGAGPLAVLSLVLGLVIVPLIQRRAEKAGDFYTADETGGTQADVPAGARRSTVIFLVVLLVSVVYAIVTASGTTFPLLALPILGIVTGLAGGLSPVEIAQHMYKGAAKLISVFLLFWLLAAVFIVIDQLAPFNVVLDMFGSSLASGSAFVFVILIALLGWVGVPGATAAQVVLLNKVFGSIAIGLGVPASAWVVVLLFASKADTYGPFPNANMVGAMGLARSTNLKNMLMTGWAILIPACIMYAIILFIQTR